MVDVDKAIKVGRLTKLIAESKHLPFSDDFVCSLGQQLIDVATEYKTLADMLKKNDRAAKLMVKDKDFIVIASDEPYFKEAYCLIRAQEIDEGRWTDEDERVFNELVRQAPGQ